MSENILNSGGSAAPEVASAESPAVESVVAPETVTEVAPEEVAAVISEAAPEPAPISEGFLSDDLREISNLKDFNSADDLAKSYVELQRMVGNSVRIPAEDATPEAKRDFYDKIKSVEGILVEGDDDLYTRLGKPETSEGYDFGDLISKETEESNPNSIGQLDEFKDLALGLNLTGEQAKSLAEWQLDQTAQSESAKIASEVQNREATMENLKSLWGNELENKLGAAKKVIDIYGEKYGDNAKKLMDGPAGDNPVFINMLSELADLYSEKGHEGMSSSSIGMTPENAQLKILEKNNDRGFQMALRDKHHADHDKFVEEIRNLHIIANGAG